MHNVRENIHQFYQGDDYIVKNPSLHEEDSVWKVSKILPLIDKVIPHISKEDVVILDVGGGAGFILAAVSDYIQKTYHKHVVKYALDLSPGMLDVQKKTNPDLKAALCEDIEKTTLKDKEIDLVLMIDVLEHVANPRQALKEIHRISQYTIFKVPLEHNVQLMLMNFLTRGRLRKNIIKNIGHINVYNKKMLEKQISNQGYEIISSGYANVFEYFLTSPLHKGTVSRIANAMRSFLFWISPSLASYVSTDFAMILAKGR